MSVQLSHTSSGQSTMSGRKPRVTAKKLSDPVDTVESDVIPHAVSTTKSAIKASVKPDAAPKKRAAKSATKIVLDEPTPKQEEAPKKRATKSAAKVKFAEVENQVEIPDSPKPVLPKKAPKPTVSAKSRGKQIFPPASTTTSKKESDAITVEVTHQVEDSVVCDTTTASVAAHVREELIAHLPVRTSMLAPDLTELVYTPNIPAPPGAYNDSSVVAAVVTMSGPVATDTSLEEFQASGNTLEATAEQVIAAIKEAVALSASAPTTTNRQTFNDKPTGPDTSRRSVIDNMVFQFNNRGSTSRIPEKTSANCYWDGHQFDSVPCVIPIREVQKPNPVTNVADLFYEADHRLFCCPECAAAQLFADPLDPFVKWARYSMLNTVYRHWYPKGHTVRPAMKKDVLDVNNGTMTIEVFRNICQEGKVRLDLMLPPMVALNPHVDLKPADYYDSHQNASFIPMNNELVDRASTSLRLARSKPKTTREGTLEKCMNVRSASIAKSVSTAAGTR